MTYTGEPKNEPFTIDEVAMFIKSAESFQPKPYNTDGAGNWTIGYGHLLSTDKNIKQWQGEYADGITETEAIELLKQDLNNKWSIMQNQMKEKNIDVDAIPNDIKTAFILYSYGGVSSDKELLNTVYNAQQNNYTPEYRKEIASKLYRQAEPKLGGIQTRMSLYRAMIEGKYDYNSDRSNFNNKDWNIYSNSEKYKPYRYEQYNYTYKTLTGNDKQNNTQYSTSTQGGDTRNPYRYGSAVSTQPVLPEEIKFTPIYKNE